jgi:hypothetical protein
MGSSTTAERRRLAVTAPPLLPSALSTASASAMCNFRGSIAHPTRSLCTLRNRRHRRSRNTRYQAGATPYLGRTSTGWITSASPDALTTYLDRMADAGNPGCQGQVATHLSRSGWRRAMTGMGPNPAVRARLRRRRLRVDLSRSSGSRPRVPCFRVVPTGAAITPGSARSRRSSPRRAGKMR